MAKFTGSPASRSASAALSMFFGVGGGEHVGRRALGQLGDQIGGAGEGERRLSLPGLSVSNCSPMSVNVFFSDAAANTVTCRCLPHRRAASRARSCRRTSTRDDADHEHGRPRQADASISRLSSWGFDDHGGGLDDGHRDDPGSRPSWSADSVLISETTVNGPHCIWTCAITRRRDLGDQADEAIARRAGDASGSFGAVPAFRGRTAASASPAITLRPDWSCPTGRVPSSIQRRTVSSLTPRSTAASLIRMSGTVHLPDLSKSADAAKAA